MNILKNTIKNERGMTMVEGLVSVGILGVVVIVMIFAMSGGALAISENNQEVNVQNLARTQMEYVKSCPYAASYGAVPVPDGYAISIGVSSVPGGNADIQKVTANISLNGELLLAVSDYKVNR